MNFTEEEKNKIIENITLIQNWIDERKDNLRNMIRTEIKHNSYTMDFVITKIEAYLSIGRSIYGFKPGVYNLLDKRNAEMSYYIIENWPKIKSEVKKVLTEQEKVYNTIMEFKI